MGSHAADRHSILGFDLIVTRHEFLESTIRMFENGIGTLTRPPAPQNTAPRIVIHHQELWQVVAGQLLTRIDVPFVPVEIVESKQSGLVYILDEQGSIWCSSTIFTDYPDFEELLSPEWDD